MTKKQLKSNLKKWTNKIEKRFPGAGFSYQSQEIWFAGSAGINEGCKVAGWIYAKFLNNQHHMESEVYDKPVPIEELPVSVQVVVALSKLPTSDQIGRN